MDEMRPDDVTGPTPGGRGSGYQGVQGWLSMKEGPLFHASRSGIWRARIVRTGIPPIGGSR
jgi:hypothetical protein